MTHDLELSRMLPALLLDLYLVLDGLPIEAVSSSAMRLPMPSMSARRWVPAITCQEHHACPHAGAD